MTQIVMMKYDLKVYNDTKGLLYNGTQMTQIVMIKYDSVFHERLYIYPANHKNQRHQRSILSLSKRNHQFKTNISSHAVYAASARPVNRIIIEVF